MRVLDENRIEELAQLELEKCDAENVEHLTKCFVENLAGNRLFEQMFSNDKHKLQMKAHEIEIAHIIEQYRLEVLKQTEKICDAAKENYAVRCEEISQYEEAIAESRNAAQSKDVEMIDSFLKEKNDLIDQYRTIAEIRRSDASGCAEKTTECESLHQNYEILIDNVWYSLMEKETTLHERIEEVRELFASNITTVVRQFKENLPQFFAGVRIGSVEYFKMIEEKIRASEINDEQVQKSCEMDRNQHMAVIDRREADLLFQVSNWLTTRLDTYKKLVQRIVWN